MSDLKDDLVSFATVLLDFKEEIDGVRDPIDENGMPRRRTPELAPDVLYLLEQIYYTSNVLALQVEDAIERLP
jgi:hypothetical protein